MRWLSQPLDEQCRTEAMASEPYPRTVLWRVLPALRNRPATIAPSLNLANNEVIRSEWISSITRKVSSRASRTAHVGLIGSSSPKIVQLSHRLPKRVWVVKTPRGMKGSIQLVASLLISEEPSVAVQTDQPNVIYYDVFSPDSVFFTDSGTPERIREVSEHFQYRWHTAFSASFRGDSGLQAMEADVVRGLEALVADWDKIQMLERVKDRDKVRPINPFAQPSN
ncbi:hypothetical protein AWB80_01243 [Caballeronia pedi]|uniref:Uncharacterized protein n=1 Tax=Caballeronia pedi TaxID=1777141 RepID=A0A157ZSZ1_9BURK|nr:hypothetical protein AWB80_01243 [Caballeronia pedi]